MNLDRLIAAAADATGMTEEMVKQSAEAHAKEENLSLEDVLAQWGGIDLETGEQLPSGTIAGEEEDDAVEETAQIPEESPAAQVQEAAPEAPVPDEPEPAAAPVAQPSGTVTPDEVAALAAEAMSMSETMVRRSAGARAKAEGKTAEEVMAEWAGVDPSSVQAASEAAASEPAAAEAPAPDTSAPEAAEEPTPAPAEAAPAPSGGGMSSDDLVAAAAKEMGMPESMVRRSAAARAKAEGISEALVLAGWAGVDPSQVSAAPAASAGAAPSGESAPAPAEPELDVEVVGEDPEPEPQPEVVPEPEPEIVPVGAIPRWLMTLFVVVPLFALAYVSFLPNGPNCGDAGLLAVDPVTGEAVECDGSAFGSVEIDYFAIGAEVYESAGCVACHGAGGAGVGAFPSFTEGALLTTFPEGQCVDHVEWVRLGTNGWPDATYGADDKPVGGSGAVMPGFGGTLSEQELAAVVLYERVAFGSEDIAEATVDCVGDPVGGPTAAGE